MIVTIYINPHAFCVVSDITNGSCGGEFTNSTGQIASSNFPSKDNEYESCAYTILAAENEYTTIHFESLMYFTSLHIIKLT